MSLELSVTTDGPADPLYVLELADGLAQIMRALNHLTLHHEALHEPADADRLIRNVSLAVSRLPQLLEQVSGWLVAEQAAGRIGMAPEKYQRGEGGDVAVALTRKRLDGASALARMVQQSLDAAASVTTDMTGVEAGDDG